MKSIFVFVFACAASISCALSDSLAPFDSLNKSNIRVEGSITKSKRDADYSYKTEWGSYDRNVTQSKTVEVTVSQIQAKKLPVAVECYIILDSQTPVPVKMEVLDSGVGVVKFNAESTKNEYHYVYAQSKGSSGNKITGWFARVIGEGKVLGFCGSSSIGISYAKDPKLLQENLK